MKQLPRACCIYFFALTAVGCATVSDIDAGLRRLDLGSDTYIARAGDTLDTIAYRYKLSTAQLAALNPGMSGSIRVGTAVNIKSASPQVAARSPNTRRARANQPAATIQRADVAIAQPVYKPRAVPDAAYAPSVAAVVTDINLLNPVQATTVVVPPELTMRNGVLEPIAYAGQEIVEEEYIHGKSELTQAAIDDELQSYVGRWSWPTEGQVARQFAPTTEGRHGVDIAGLPGQQVVAVMDGTVAYSGKDPSGAGNLIIVRHKDDLLTAYSHTKDLYVAEQDTVRAGDPIATLGANSRQESVLRFEVRQKGNPLDPMDFLTVR